MNQGSRARKASQPEPEARPRAGQGSIGVGPVEAPGIGAGTAEAPARETDVGTTASHGKPLDPRRAAFAAALADLVLADLLKYPPDKS